MKDVAIIGIGSYSPSKIITNNDLSEIVETTDQWISERTGIKERRISNGEDTSIMATKAAKEAIRVAGISEVDIDLIIVATITPDMYTPSTACIVQKNIGANNATAFDINAACSGFIYGIQMAESLMKIQNYKNALVIGSETLSKIVDWTDRSTCVLFGDGAGAVVISDSNIKGIYKTYSKSDGAKGDCLTSGALEVNSPFVQEKLEKNQYIKMDGREVFKFATSVIAEAVNKVLSESDISIDDVAYIIPHQANMRIIQYAAKRLGVSMDKFYVNLDKYGNTSSASIPVALNELYKSGELKKGDKIILVGFGGGLTYGSALIEWSI